MATWNVVPLERDHDRAAFSCGQPSLDRFLKESARQNQEKGVSRTFVLLRDEEPRVYGYHTLSAGEVHKDDLPPKLAKKLPKYPVPVAVLGRLAVDVSVQRQEHGRRLLTDALRRILSAADVVGIFAVVVDAIDDRAAAFYARFGFEPIPDAPSRLLLPLGVIRGAQPRKS
ncbi:MAG: GNAT family N-acetyltransferase [Gemmataceae bacterium]